VSDWKPTDGNDAGTDGADLDLSDLDWSGSPVPDGPVAPAAPFDAADPPLAAGSPFVQDEPPVSRNPVTERRGSPSARRQGNHAMDMRISRLGFWGSLVAALVVGAAIGVGLLLWQRAALNSDIRALETKLATAEASSTAITQQLQDLETRLVTADASVADLTAKNTQLTADLAAAKKALDSKQSSGTVTVTERTVSPTSVETSHTLTLAAKVQGKADKVQMKIVGTGGVVYSKVYNLTKSTTSGDIVTWKRAVTAPGKKGMYRYYATAFVGTKKYEMPGVSAWTFEVK
jgi:cytoskeletal protein RodZ